MGGEPDLTAGGQLDDRVEGDEPDPAGGRPVARDHEEGVIATGTQAGDGTHGVAAPTIRDQPLPARPFGERAAGLRTEDDRGHPGSLLTDTHQGECRT